MNTTAIYTRTLCNLPTSMYQHWEITTPDGLHLCTVIGLQDADALLDVLNKTSEKSE